jgi:galactokinase
MNSPNRLRAAFEALAPDGQAGARLFCAPGRINLIGEHTDYAGGQALAGALDRCVYVAITPPQEAMITATALDRGETRVVDPHAAAQSGWAAFVLGAAKMAAGDRPAPSGAQLMFASDVPEGAGVSSSAALACALCLAFSSLWGRPLTGMDLARAAQRVEQRYVGVPCGLMDQWASACGAPGQFLHMDFAQETAARAALPDGAACVVIHSGVRHQLQGSGYAGLFQAAADARAALGVAHLAHAQAEAVAQLPAALNRAGAYVLGECARVASTVAALAQGDLNAAGAAMQAGHEALRTALQITVPETDHVQAVLSATPGVFGARQMGGGFGGAVIGLVEADRAAHILASTLSAIHATKPQREQSFIARLGDGARELSW